MTIATDARSTRRSELTPAQLKSLQPHVISLVDGRLSREGVPAPQCIADFKTTEADIDEIFSTHLPAFKDEKDLATVPIVLYAHGGLVDKAAGFSTAQLQVDWWKANGVYPIHFVWESGLWTALWDAIGRWVIGDSRGIADGITGIAEEAKDFTLEKAARILGGRGIWLMKLDAAASSDPHGGARKLARKLAAWMKSHPDAATVHAVGHSAGSIFHSHLIPVALDAGVPKFQTVSFLAPAVRMDTFRQLLLPRTNEDIGNLTIFTMTDAAERDDTCPLGYRKSLLYLVSASCESRQWTPLLGLSKDIEKDAIVDAFLKGPRGELIHSPNDASQPCASTAQHHGDFDNDAPTMESVLLRVTGTADVAVPFPVDLDRQGATANVPRTSTRVARHKVALCIGIDEYPRPADRLRGCVKDAQLWHSVLTEAGFQVNLLTNKDATRAGILGSILQLILGATPGDTLVVQYSGHGTYVPDVEGGEEHDKRDEATCPVDFREGQLILDDDLAQLWDLIPENVSLTIFFDSCHSGGANRAGEPTESLSRSVELNASDITLFHVARGVAAPAGRTNAHNAIGNSQTDTVSTTITSRAATEREALFAACAPTQLAWETNGQGDFTRTVAPLIAKRIGTVTNSEFYGAILANFRAHRQNPTFTGTDPVRAAPFLANSFTERGNTGHIAAPDSVITGTPSSACPHDAAIATILRGIADLLDS